MKFPVHSTTRAGREGKSIKYETTQLTAHRFLNNYNNLLFALTFPVFAAWSIYLILGWWLSQLRPRDLGDLIATRIEVETPE